MKDTEHLKWIHDRLSKFHKENHDIDYLVRFRKIIARFDIMEDMLKAPPYDKLSELHHSALMSSQAKVKTLEADNEDLKRVIREAYTATGGVDDDPSGSLLPRINELKEAGNE